MNFDKHGEIVETVPFEYPDEEAADLSGKSPEELSAIKIAIAGIVAEVREEAWHEAEAELRPSVARSVLESLAGGHREPSAVLSRIASAMWKAGIVSLQEAAKMAGKSTRLIRITAEKITL